MSEPRSEALHNSIYDTLQHKIIHGLLKPGSKVVESRLAKELQISRTPLREALFKLEQDGLLLSEVNKGFIVKPLTAREARELYPILWNLEALALELSGPLAFMRSSELSQLNKKFEKSAGHSRAACKIDSLWHQMLIRDCPNKFLMDLIERLRKMIERYEWLFMRDSLLISESVKQHNLVICALQKHNRSDAQDALINNWRTGLEILLLRIGEP